MKKNAIVIGVVVLGLIAVGLIYYLSRPVEGQEVTVGAMMPLTGDNAVYGKALQQGMLVALDEANKAGKIYGIPLNIIFEDDQANPTLGVSAFNKLIDIDHVPMVLGSMFSNVSLAIAPIGQSKHIVLLSPTSSSVDLTNAGDYFFRIYPSDTYDGQFSADFAFNTLKARKIAIFFAQESSTTAVAKVFANEFTALGGQIVLSEGHKQGDTDFRASLGKIQQAQPDVVFLPSLLNEMALILKQAKELGISTQFLSISTFNDPKILELAGSGAEGVIFSTPFYDPKSSDQLTKAFINAFQQKYGSEPNIWSGYGYDVVRVAVQALREAGKPFLADAIKGALYQIKDFPGVTGTVTFDKNGDVQKPLRMMVVQHGAFAPFVTQ
jgi:branched-chain amino acid transport system substrate-binding protein